jgi:hypothetical protein
VKRPNRTRQLLGFVCEWGSPFKTAGLARMIERAAIGAGLELKAHPHVLRHACSYALANKGHDTRAIQGWLGRRSITSTTVHTALLPSANGEGSDFTGKISPACCCADRSETNRSHDESRGTGIGPLVIDRNANSTQFSLSAIRRR